MQWCQTVLYEGRRLLQSSLAGASKAFVIYFLIYLMIIPFVKWRLEVAWLHNPNWGHIMHSSHGRYCNCCFEPEHLATTAQKKRKLKLFEMSTLAGKVELLLVSGRLICFECAVTHTRIQYFAQTNCWKHTLFFLLLLPILYNVHVVLINLSCSRWFYRLTSSVNWTDSQGLSLQTEHVVNWS